jgi:hypothetical protein
MRKSVITTITTFVLAAAIITGSTSMTTFALAAKNTGTSISAEKLTQPMTTKEDMTGTKSKVTISSLEDSPEMAAKRTSTDMDKEKATYIALEAIEKKFNISLNGTYATPILCTRTGHSELVYFISFVELDSITASKEEVIKEKEAVIKNKETVIQSDIYIAFINSKTGEVISAEKNPVGVDDGQG